LAWIFLRERPTGMQPIAIGLCAAGLAVLIYPLAETRIPIGILLALATGEEDAAWVVYVRPEVVVEVAFADVQESPHYPGGMALRFARVKRYRPDKTAAEADTVDTVRAIFAASRG